FSIAVYVFGDLPKGSGSTASVVATTFPRWIVTLSPEGFSSWTGTHPSLGCTTALAMATGSLPLGRRSNNHGPWHLSAEVVLAMTQHSVKEAKVTSFSMMTSTLLLAVVASTNRRLFPSICSTASAMSSVQPKRRRKSQPRTQRFPLTVKCVPSAASKLPLRHGSVGIPDCTSVTAEPVSISIFVGHPSILLTTAIRSLPWRGVQPFRSGNTYAALVAVHSRLSPSHSHLDDRCFGVWMLVPISKPGPGLIMKDSTSRAARTASSMFFGFRCFTSRTSSGQSKVLRNLSSPMTSLASSDSVMYAFSTRCRISRPMSDHESCARLFRFSNSSQ
ncbi:hypothetical protein D917_09520, partial [Trichinella nativa]